ncbi:hypothetical protein B0G80_3690 [Paraburkholderia sp. BL6669N2]|nr:hypothetical protein B0G80_3690 [Paraburkholderia sp. BL6669N2]
MRGSPHLLPATGFKNVAEVDAFMLKHAFPTVSTFASSMRPPEEPARRQQARVVFNASPDVLRLMASLELASKQNRPVSNVVYEYWSDVSHAVLSYLGERIGLQPSIDRALQAARETADVQLVANML